MASGSCDVGASQQVDDFCGAVADDDVSGIDGIRRVMGSDGLSQREAVGIGVCGQINGGDGFNNAGRRAQGAHAGREVQAVFHTQAQGAQFRLLDAAVDGAGRWGNIALTVGGGHMERLAV